MIAVIDFGSQYTQLIARRIRECKIYSEIFSCQLPIEEILRNDIHGLILSGGPGNVYTIRYQAYERLFQADVPILGICYGMQLAASVLGGKVLHTAEREYGHASVTIASSPLFATMPRSFRVWMSHGDSVVRLPRTARVIARTTTTRIAGFVCDHIYALQFHPEVRHTQHGMKIINNFLTRICHAPKTWSMTKFVDEEVSRIKETAHDDRVMCAVSGGIDSTVAAALATKAIGKRLVSIFVDNGLLRHGERAEVKQTVGKHVHLKVIDARHRFLSRLRHVRDPEHKRKIIGREFIKVFEAEAKRVKGMKYLVQGTLYPDVIESGQGIGPSAIIKSHHNVGGLPKRMRLKVIEPLRMLFKDEVRTIAKLLGLPPAFIHRKPFPGPGLAVRIIGPVTEARLNMLRRADWILCKEASSLHNFHAIWQIFAVLLPLGSVGVMGDQRTYDSVCAIRAVRSDDGMTADWVRLPHSFLARVSSRITNEIKGINRVVFDITSKPPSTIEWE